MKNADTILGLFYSNENNLIFDKIKFSENLSKEKDENLRMLSYKFLSPIFLTAASSKEANWKIDLVESSLSLYQGITKDVDIIQSFFNLNSSIELEGGITNLYALIGSPYTEDIKSIYKRLGKYIHPSIIQGKIVNESIFGSDFNFTNYIKNELNRGINLIECALGGSRKMHWETQQNYYCLGLIERKNSTDSKILNLYTFDKDDPLRKKLLPYIPSYYVMTILPDFYEKLILETLALFDKKSNYPNIRFINLSSLKKKVIYLEEFLTKNGANRSFGVILTPENELTSECKNLSFYKKNLRLLLDANKDLGEILSIINPNFKNEKWSAISDEELDKIRILLDQKN